MQQVFKIISDINATKKKVIINQSQTRDRFRKMKLKNEAHSKEIKAELERRRKSR